MTLSDVVDAYADAKAEADAAADRLKDARDRLLEAQADRGEITGSYTGTRSAVVVSQRSAWRIDSTRLKAEHPEVYAAYARQSYSTTVTVVPR